jgi:hypothetical protein
VEQSNFPSPGAEASFLSHKAWTAYCPTVLSAVLALGVLGGGVFYVSRRIGVIVMAVILLISIYHAMVIRSHRLYCDAIGVWISSGVLPWSKGVQGIKWRDLDAAAYTPGFWSWLFGSYTLRIGHRYAKDNEILLTRMVNGKEAVTAINERHQGMGRQDAQEP